MKHERQVRGGEGPRAGVRRKSLQRETEWGRRSWRRRKERRSGRQGKKGEDP